MPGARGVGLVGAVEHPAREVPRPRPRVKAHSARADMAARWQPDDSLARFDKGLSERSHVAQRGKKDLYMGTPMPHMHASEKRPMHSGARGGGILIA